MQHKRLTTIKTLKSKKTAIINELAALTKKELPDPSNNFFSITLESLTDSKKLSKKKKTQIAELYRNIRKTEAAIVSIQATRILIIAMGTGLISISADQLVKTIYPGFSMGKDFYAATAQLFPMLIIALYISEKPKIMSREEVILFVKRKAPILVLTTCGMLESLLALTTGGTGLFQFAYTFASIFIASLMLMSAAFPKPISQNTDIV